MCVPSGLRAGDEVLAVNGAAVSRLDLDLMQSLFSHQELWLLLRRDESHESGDPADACTPPPPGGPDWTAGMSSLSLVLGSGEEVL